MNRIREDLHSAYAGNPQPLAGIEAVSLLHVQISTLTTKLLNTNLGPRTPQTVRVNCSNFIHTLLPPVTMENSHTPTLASPDIETPPPPTKRTSTNGHITNGAGRAGSEPVDPTALSKALKDMEDVGRVRQRTPGASPSRKRQRVYGDRSVKSAMVVIFKDSRGRW